MEKKEKPKEKEKIEYEFYNILIKNVPIPIKFGKKKEVLLPSFFASFQ